MSTVPSLVTMATNRMVSSFPSQAKFLTKAKPKGRTNEMMCDQTI